MTAQILISELTTLIQDSKRKAPEIRTAAEKSLADLKSLPNTSEVQLAADLKKRPNFTKPFVLSCASKNPRFAGTSIACLQRLIISNGLAHESLKDVLGGLRDCTALAQDIQLKILQVLPTLLQNYANLITGELLATALHTCFALLASKANVISNTAAATIQQLVVSVFDKVQQEDEAQTDDFVLDVPVEDGEVSVQRSALDAYRLLYDLCLLIEGEKPEFLKATAAPPNFCLELIEAIFSNNAEIVSVHPEQVHILRLKLMPFTIRVLSDRLPFSTTVRSMRLLPVIFSNMLSVLAAECEMILSLLNHMLDPDASIHWKRVLCMEVLRSIHSEPALVRNMFAHFDAKEGKRNIVQDQMSLMVHMASEKPAVIGLGQQSTVPATDQTEESMDEMAALQAEGISGTIGVAMTLKSSTAPGISSRLSSMRVSCLEQLDKNEAPSIPPAYIYSLVLTCLNGFSEGIARFLLPFTAPNEKGRRRARTKDDQALTLDAEKEETDPRPPYQRAASSSSYKIPINPLSLESHVLYDQINTSAKMVDACWPALLAAYSTYFHAALDSEYYRDLVRSFQKFTQIAGLLHLPTPRDAFLTALGKNAVPSGPVALPGSAVESQDPERPSMESQPSVSEKGRSSFDSTRASLNSRNLLCLRALLNLGIALGPVLGTAWKIVLGTLQQADTIINHIISMRQRGRGGQNGGPGNDSNFLGDIGDQMSAVSGAAERLFESTGDLPDYSYRDVLSSLCGLFKDIVLDTDIVNAPTKSSSLSTPKTHKRGPSMSGELAVFTVDSRLNLFVIDKLSKLMHYNEFRFLEHTAEQSGWSLLSKSLQQITSAQSFDATLRVRAARVLADLVNISASSDVPSDNVEETRYQGLKTMDEQISGLYPSSFLDAPTPKGCEVEIHCILLEALQTALEKYGESLTRGWSEVFAIINSVFSEKAVESSGRDRSLKPRIARIKGSKLVRTAFSSLQLICSDFLGALPPTSYPDLLTTASSFCTQQDEFNISLTSTTLFCNVSDHIWDGEDTMLIDRNIVQSSLAGLAGPDQFSKPRIWFDLLIALVESSSDERTEVRRGAIHSIIRILDSIGENLPAESWLECHESILMTVISRNQSHYVEAQSNPSTVSETIMNWNETTIMLLDSLPGVFATGIEAMLGLDSFLPLWEKYLGFADQILQRRSLAVSGAMYTALAKIVSDAGHAGKDISRHAVLLWNLWNTQNPVNHLGLPRKTVDNQAALLAYARCFAAFYPQLSKDLSKDTLEATLGHLKLCITGSSTTPYAGDVDTLTPLQDQVIECVKMIHTGEPDAILLVNSVLAAMSTLALDREETRIEAKGPTFVAVSKTAIDMLLDHLVTNRSVKRLYAEDGLVQALTSLARSIHLKYSWELQGKEPPMWKKATQATIGILGATIPELSSSSMPSQREEEFWEATIDSCAAIISTPDEQSSMTQQLLVDQDFDVESFMKLFDLIIPRLGSSKLVPDHSIGQLFASTLLRYSFIHEPHPDDLPLPDENQAEPLECLVVEHLGRTNDLPPSPRSKMSYAVTEKLFELVAVHQSSSPSAASAWQQLAIAASPYLILRVGLTLKAYVLDQPLRGRMPQPASQRKELLYLLRMLVDLNSEPAAFKHAPSMTTRSSSDVRNKKHLFMVLPLVSKALQATKRDDELRKALTSVIDTMSREFGVYV